MKGWGQSGFETPLVDAGVLSDQVAAATAAAAAAQATANSHDVYWSTSASQAYDTSGGKNCALVDTTAGIVSLTLPPGSPSVLGIRRSMIKTAGGNQARFVPSGADTIEGVAALGFSTSLSRADVVWAGDMYRRATSVISTSNFLSVQSNLVDVASPKLARQAIGANEHLLNGHFSAVPGTVGVFSWVYSAAFGNAFILDFMATLAGTTNGTVILQLALNGVNVTPTISLAAGVLGARQYMAATGSNSIPAQGYLSVTVSGTNNLPVMYGIQVRCSI